jgi:translation initiation factor 2 alpha subunit (eIF-2alpha)
MTLEMSEKELHLEHLLEALASRLTTPKSELVKEIEAQLTTLLGIEAREAFDAVAAAQHYPAPSLNLDRVHKSALILLAHVLGEATGK